MEDLGQGVLLESGNNELEVMEFSIGQYEQIINVLKIKKIIEYVPDNVTNIFKNKKHVIGVIENELGVIPIVCLRSLYGLPLETDEKRCVIITEFNEKLFGFVVDKISTKCRITWSDLQPLRDATPGSYIVAMTSLHNRNLGLVDFEAIVVDLFSQKIVVKDCNKNLQSERKQFKIAHADDSETIRKLVKKLLTSNGYTNLTTFTNGEDVYHEVLLANYRDDPKEHYDIVLTDIEMPRMDGLTVCKKLKAEFSELKVMVLSSLVSEQLLLRCEAVKADKAVSKNKVDTLVNEVDQLAFNQDEIQDCSKIKEAA
jgi:two-component system, chemotaxis family, chemotaxis protein CheV